MSRDSFNDSISMNNMGGGSVPLALAGALIALRMGNHTMNIFSQIGIIALVGIVTKNGILIVEFANQRFRSGLSNIDAVVEASTLRLRPILMTSLATILGVLPIALALGAASTSRIPMGVAIIGGLMFSLLLILFVIPAIYTFFKRKHYTHDKTWALWLGVFFCFELPAQPC